MERRVVPPVFCPFRDSTTSPLLQGRPLPGVPEDYLVVLETADLEPQQIFLEDIRRELYPHCHWHYLCCSLPGLIACSQYKSSSHGDTADYRLLRLCLRESQMVFLDLCALASIHPLRPRLLRSSPGKRSSSLWPRCRTSRCDHPNSHPFPVLCSLEF